MFPATYDHQKGFPHESSCSTIPALALCMSVCTSLYPK